MSEPMYLWYRIDLAAPLYSAWAYYRLIRSLRLEFYVLIGVR